MAISKAGNPYFTGKREDSKLYNFVNSLQKIDKMYAFFKSGAFFTMTYDEFADESNYYIYFTCKEWEERFLASPYFIKEKGIYKEYDWVWSEKCFMLYADIPKPSKSIQKTAKEYEAEIMSKDYFAKSRLMAKNIRLFGEVAVPKKEMMEDATFYCFFKNSEGIIEEYKKISKKYSDGCGTIEFIVKGEMYKAVVSNSRVELEKEIVYKQNIKITKLYGN